MDTYFITRQFANQTIEIIKNFSNYAEAIAEMEKIETKIKNDNASFIAVSANNKTKYLLVQCPVFREIDGSKL